MALSDLEKIKNFDDLPDDYIVPLHISRIVGTRPSGPIAAITLCRSIRLTAFARDTASADSVPFNAANR